MAIPRGSRITDADRAIAARIKALRAKRPDLGNQTDLAAKTGHGQSWWSGIENARSRPSGSNIGEIALSLGVDLDLIVYGPRPGMDADAAEFVAQLRTIGEDLDPRGRRTVLALARQQVQEADDERESQEPTPFRPRPPRAPGGRSLEELPPGVTRGMPPPASEPAPSELDPEEEREAGAQLRQFEAEAAQEPGERITPEAPPSRPPPTRRRRRGESGTE